MGFSKTVGATPNARPGTLQMACMERPRTRTVRGRCRAGPVPLALSSPLASDQTANCDPAPGQGTLFLQESPQSKAKAGFSLHLYSVFRTLYSRQNSL